MTALSQLKLADGTLNSLADLIHDLRVLGLSSFMQEANAAIEPMRYDETWEVNRSGLTSLPITFENLMKELTLTLADVLLSQSGEEEIFARVAVQNKVSQLTAALFSKFILCLDHLAFDDDDPPVEASLTERSEPTKPSLEKRLIIVLSNLQYTRKEIIPHILQNFQNLNFPHMPQTKQVTEMAFSELNEKLFAAYLEHRIEPLGAALEPGMYTGYFDWNDCLRPTGKAFNIIVMLFRICLHINYTTF